MKETNILWLSDIHLNTENNYDFPKKEALQKFIEKLIKYLKSTNINHLIISGDLSMDGGKECFDFLNELLVKPIKTAYTDIIITICPGNHDLFYDQVADIEYIEERDLNIFLEEKEPTLINRFQSYSAFAKDIYGDKFNDLSKGKNCLYGYTKDEANKLIIITLNSAWFAEGSRADEILLDRIFGKEAKDTKKLNLSKHEVNEILRSKAKISEIGNLIIGKQHIETVLSKIEEFDDYLKIAVFHHPFSWLSWAEINNPKSPHEPTSLVKLLNKCQLILTGHEHTPISSSKNAILDNVVHLQGGMFLSHHFHEHGEFNNVRCSLIKINSNLSTFVEERLNYIDRGEGVPEWYEPEYAKRNNFFTFSLDIKDWTLNDTFILKLKGKLFKNFGDGISLKGKVKLYQENADSISVFLLENIFLDESNVEELRKIINNYRDVKNVKFMSVDVIVHTNAVKNYDSAISNNKDLSKNKITKEEVFEKIYNDLKLQFHIFEDKLKDNLDENNLAEVTFTNEVIKYWDTARYE